MQKLNYRLMILCKRNPEGSKSTQANRFRILQLAADQLHQLGYKNLSIHNLKPKHVTALLNLWNQENLSAGTLKNRMAALRWWSRMVDKQRMLSPNNSAYNINRRQYVTNVNKAKQVSEETLDSISDNFIKCSLELQKAFGLRREESIKFIPRYADKGDHIQLKGTWCKGGRPRSVIIRNDHQREVLKRAHMIAKDGSLIPPTLNYRQQLKRYEYTCAKVGLTRLHGLRHHYAQQRYEELTGWKAPAEGGPQKKQLSAEQRVRDYEARLIISEELGHHREEVTAIYLGR